MPKHTFSDPFAPVDIQPVMVAGDQVQRVAVRVRDDDNEWTLAGILGKGYQLIPNRRVRDITDDVLSRAPESLGGFKNIKTLWDGKRYVDYFSSNNPVSFVRGGGEQQTLKLGVMAWNAYDGSRKVGFEVFILNDFCTNQYYSRNRLGFFAFRHTEGEAGEIDVTDALDNISRGVDNVIRFAPLISELRQQPLALDDVVKAKAKIDIPQTRWGDVLDALGEQPGRDGQTKYGLYQALTSVASHKLGGIGSIGTGSDITDYFIPTLGKDVMNHTTAERVVAEKDGPENGEDGVLAEPGHVQQLPLHR